MSELISIYRRYLALCNERRFDALSAFVHDPFHVKGQPNTLAQYAGRLAALTQTVPDFHWELVDHVEQGEKLAVRIRATGTPRGEWLGVAPTGKSFSVTELVIYTFREGKIVDIWVLFDLAELQAQLA